MGAGRNPQVQRMAQFSERIVGRASCGPADPGYRQRAARTLSIRRRLASGKISLAANASIVSSRAGSHQFKTIGRFANFERFSGTVFLGLAASSPSLVARVQKSVGSRGTSQFGTGGGSWAR